MKGKKKIEYWKKERDDNSIIWRNTVDSSLTMEIHKLDDSKLDELEEMKYFAFPAKNGEGIPHTPEQFIEKKDAIDYAKEYMKNWSPNGAERGWQKNYWGV